MEKKNKSEILELERAIFADVIIQHLKKEQVFSFDALQKDIDIIKQHPEFSQENIVYEEKPIQKRGKKHIKLTWKGLYK